MQAVCSPIRNPLPRAVRVGLGFASSRWAWGFIRLARAAKVPDPPFRWDVVEGPWFDNNIATLAVRGERWSCRGSAAWCGTRLRLAGRRDGALSTRRMTGPPRQ
jgi:hypothetical protein